MSGHHSHDRRSRQFARQGREATERVAFRCVAGKLVVEQPHIGRHAGLRDFQLSVTGDDHDIIQPGRQSHAVHDPAQQRLPAQPPWRQQR